MSPISNMNNTVDNSKSLAIDTIRLLSKGAFKISDILTYPIHQIIDHPGRKIQKSKSIKGVRLNNEDIYSPFRNINSIEKLSNLLFPDSPTLDKVWDRIVQLYGNNPCFGTREIIKIYDNHKEDGKVFQKVKLGKYKWITFNKVNDMVINLSKSIKFLNIPKKSNVIIFADTRAEWQITALACYKSGYTVVTIYPTLGKEAVKDAIIESDAPIIFTTSSHFDIIYDISNDIPNIKHIIYFEDRFYPTYKDPTKGEKLIYLKNKFVTCEYFDDFIYKREDYNDTIECTSTDDDVCLIMYTSGSVGKPKGVLLTHKNVIAAVVGMSNVVKATKKDTYIGYLPLAHILEICAEFIALSQGAKVGYSSAQTLIDTAAKIYPGTKGDTRELKPTILAAVPAVMDRIYKAVLDKVSNSGKISKEIFNICYERRLKRFEKGYSSLLIDRIIFKKIKNLLGGKVRLLISGGAPLSPTSQRFMNICFGCPVSQGYGLTETCGAAAITEGTDLSTGYVGAPLICNEIYLKECENTDYKPSNVPPQGEILIHGDNVCKGYYKNPKKTEEEFIIINGKRYFCTGDIGEIREDGSLKIIDRKKDLVKLSHGEYVSLGKVEANLITNKFVDTICVYANPNSSYVVALVVPNKNATIKLGNELSCKTDDWEELCKNKTLINAFTNELMTFGKNKLEKFEIPKKIFLCHEPWTSANGLMTEALKLKRNVIEKRFKKEIDSITMYTTDDSSTSIQSVDTTTHREEIELKKRLADEKIKESKLECIKEEDEIEPSGVEKKISKLMSYDWTFLDLVILIYSALSILSFSRCFIACMLLLPTDEGLFYAFSGLYWFVTIYPTYKFFTNLNVRGAVMVHLYVNIISGGSLVFIVGLTFINSRYIAQRYYSYYIILLFDAFMQFMSIIVLSFVPFKVIRTRSIFKVSNDYSIKIGNGLADATVKVYNSTKKSIEELMNNKKEETPASKTVIKLDSKHSDTITSNKYGSPTKRL